MATASDMPTSGRSRASARRRRATVTLRDVAREAGVSAATASRALNGSARNVRSENVARVQAAATKLNYQPDMSAQATARGSTGTVALVVSAVEDPYFSTIAAGVVDRAEQASLIVTMAVAGRSPERELHLVRTLRGQRPRAIVVAGSRRDDQTGTATSLTEELHEYRTAGGRVVMISQRHLPFPTVTIDNRRGAEQLGRALTEIGYRRFAIIRATGALDTSRERYDGFLAGLRHTGVDVDQRFVVETDFNRDGGYHAARNLVERGLDDTELIFAVTDLMAIGAMTALRDVGLVPGKDIAVAGFDDIASTRDVDPPLTSVAIPLRHVGWIAMDAALGDDDNLQEVVHVSTDVVLRESSPPVQRLIAVT